MMGEGGGEGRWGSGRWVRAGGGVRGACKWCKSPTSTYKLVFLGNDNWGKSLLLQVKGSSSSKSCPAKSYIHFLVSH